MSLRLKSVISKEEDLTLSPPVNKTKDEIDLQIMEINRELEELEPDINEMDQNQRLVDQVIEDAEELERLTAIATEALKTGNHRLNKLSIALINNKIETIRKRNVIDTSRVNGIFTVESFDSVEREVIALESVGGFLKGMWEKIIVVIKAIWNGIASFWKRHLGTIERLIKQLKGLKKKVESKKDAQIDNDKKVMIPKSILKLFLPTGEGEFNIKVIGSLIRRQELAILECSGYMDDLSNKATKAIGDAMGDPKEAFSVTLLKSIPIDKLAPKDKFGTEKEPLFGGKYGVFDDTEISEDNPKLLFKWEDVSFDREGDVELELPTIPEILELIDRSISSLTGVRLLSEAFLKTRKAFEKQSKNIERYMNKQQVEKIADGENVQEVYKAGAKFFNDLNKLLPKILNSLVKGEIKGIKGVVKYINLSFKKLK